MPYHCQMLDCIWHLRGSTQIDAQLSDEDVLDRVADLLTRQRKPVTQRGKQNVKFYAPLWHDLVGPNWLAMVIYDHGSFWIEEARQGRQLRYDLRSLHGFIFCLCGSAMFFAVGLANGEILGGLKYALFAFGWLYGMNMLLAWLRIPPKISAVASVS